MLKKAKKHWKNEFFRGGVFLTISSTLINILNYFFNFLAARLLGPSGFGEISTLFSYLCITAVPIAVLTTLIIQKVSSVKNRLTYARSLEDFFWLKINNWWFLIIIAFLLTPIIPRITNLSNITAYIFFPLIILSFLSSFYSAAFQGLRFFFLFSVIQVGMAIIKLLGPILVAVGIDGLVTVILFLSLSSLMTMVVTKFFFHQKTKEIQFQPTVQIERRLINILTRPQVFITGISMLSLILFNNLDVIFVKKFFLATDAGIYSSWSLFAKIILYIISPLSSISFVFFASKKDPAQNNKTLMTLLMFLTIVGLVSFIGYSLFAPVIIGILFGNKFNAAIPYLSLASIFGSFYAAISFINYYFLAKKSRLALLLALFIPFYILFLFLIPRQLIQIMRLNIIFSAAMTTIYLIAYFMSRKGENI